MGSSIARISNKAGNPLPSSHIAEKQMPAEQPHPTDQRFRLLVESVRDYAIFMLDPQGNILTWNAGAERFKGYRAEEIVGQNFSKFYPAEDLHRGLPAHDLQAAASEGSFETESWRVRKDGSQFWANVVITAMREPHAQLIGFAAVTRDLTERRNHDEALRRSEERFRLLVEGVPDYAIFMLDVNGLVASWNVGAQRIKGYAAQEILGQHFSTFYPSDVKASGWPEHELQVARDAGSFRDEGWRVRKDGSCFWAQVTITALKDDAGRLIGFAKLTRDLTALKTAEAAGVASSERDTMLDAERSARIAAQRAARVKDEFLATLSHELRTPLSAIMGWTQLLKKAGEDVKVSDVNRAVDVIDRNVRVQVQLVDDLLDLSRIISGKIRLDLRQFPLMEAVQAAVDSARPVAEAKGIRLDAVLDPMPATVNADSGRLQQVVWNLLSNAIKFTPKGGRVQVLLQRVNSHVEISVSDTGIGIPAEFLPHVFDRFSQQDSSTTRAYGGLGLGLAISKQLVELHGGSMRVASQGPNRGATFFVELPLSIVQIEDDRAREHPSVDSRERDPVHLPDLHGLHMLIVDDEADARDLLRRVLENQGAQVSSFDSAADALHALARIRPAAIVCDIGMPEMDGFQFIRALRAREVRGERVPALALTAFARAEDRKQSLMAGYQAHLAKPYDVGELILLLADLARR